MAKPNHSNRSTALPLHSPHCTVSHTEVAKLPLARPKHSRTDNVVEKSWSYLQEHSRPSASKRYHRGNSISTPTRLSPTQKLQDLLRAQPHFFRRDFFQQQDVRNAMRGLCSSASTFENGHSFVGAVGDLACER
jgi:hypothetical protein